MDFSTLSVLECDQSVLAYLLRSSDFPQALVRCNHIQYMHTSQLLEPSQELGSIITDAGH